jgi:hypothetical protein
MAKPKPLEPLVQVNIRMPTTLRERIESFARRGDAKINPTVVALIQIGLEKLGEPT